MYRQGDVLLDPVDKVKGKQVTATNGRIVLAEGEVTGHAHVLDSRSAVEFGNESGRYVSVVGSNAITHEEHAPIPTKQENYQIIQQREYTPEAIRNVAD